MLVFVLGTTAELIKLRPVIDRCTDKTDQIEIWCTAQQYSELITLPDVVAYLSSHKTRWLTHGFLQRSISRPWHVPIWALSASIGFLRSAFKNRKNRHTTTVLVHGDTMTTALGAVLARSMKYRVGHIEAGLRSGDWRNPFPEEICRRIVGRIADLHFAPNDTAASNLSESRGEVIVTDGNTAVDNLPSAHEDPGTRSELRDVLVLLHRVEFLGDADTTRDTLLALTVAARDERINFVVDSLANKYLSGRPEYNAFARHPNVRIIAKLPHAQFLELLLRSRVVVTDSGGVQEESAALGVPCIVHRVVSERPDGLRPGGNAVLTGMRTSVLVECLQNPPNATVPRSTARSPSDVIVNELSRRRLIG